MNEAGGVVSELPVVAALRALSVFGADQEGAYREFFSELAAVLGDDIETKLGRFLAGWARERTPGVVVLTGNAGTGKTAAAEAYCRALNVSLPTVDELVTVAPDRRVIKDLSGLRDQVEAIRSSLEVAEHSQTLICANEGVLRDTLEEIGHQDAAEALDRALLRGAESNGSLTIVNVNRQRPTSDHLWGQLLDYVTRADLWAGCSDCPFDAGGCPMRSNAEQLRREEVREQLRTLVRLGTGEAVPTLREILAILSWAIVGGTSCGVVKKRQRDLGKDAFTASDGYFSRVLGGGLPVATAEKSPLLTGMRRTGLGRVSDLEVDGWLRDTNGAPTNVRFIAGCPDQARTGVRHQRLIGSKSPLDRVQTKQHEMTFYELGEMVSTDEDATRVDDGLEALVRGDAITNPAAQSLWRQRVFFETPSDLGGYGHASRRLLNYPHIHELLQLSAAAASNSDAVLAVNEIVRGLNFLVTGFASPDEGLIVPDPACLFARDPGSFRPASPSLIHNLIQVERLSISVPDKGLVEKILDVDHIEVDLVVDGDHRLRLRIRPRMYEAIREAAEYRGPVGQGVAEMNDLRGFYGRLAEAFPPVSEMRVADPDSSPPGLVKITLPRFLKAAGEQQ